MTLGQSSPSLFFVALTFTIISSALPGCAFGEVTGTGDSRNPDRSSFDTQQPAPAGGSTTEPSTSEPAGASYDALFDAPENPTATDDVITGLWAGTTSYGEVRLKLSADKVVIAIKCGDSPATGMEVGALITSTKLKILASKNVTSGSSCGIKVTPVEIPRCNYSNYDCFDLDGTMLTFGSTTLFTTNGSSYQSKYTKLSD
jgi:hypothetical protein